MRFLETPLLNGETIEMTSTMEKPSSSISKVRMALPVGKCNSNIEVRVMGGQTFFLVLQHPCSVGKLLRKTLLVGGWGTQGFIIYVPLDGTIMVSYCTKHSKFVGLVKISPLDGDWWALNKFVSVIIRTCLTLKSWDPFF